MQYLTFGGDMNRRVFIKGLGTISLGLLVGTSLGGCEDLFDKIANRPTRRRLRTGSALVDADIATYRQAVQMMMSRPASDPLSWTAEATIHGVQTHFNYCQHGTNGFFPWHRAYLLYFERICQKLTNNPKFGLPYWNWNQNPGIHPAFLDTASPLFHARTHDTVAGTWAVSTAALDPIFADGNFFSFSQQLETTPHNTVHVVVGGDMGSSPSAFDPVFWMHHCMVDYCWAKWNLELGNANTNDPTWTGTTWTHFVDTDGNPVSVTSGITTLMPLLSYQYESSAIGSSPAKLVARFKADFDTLRARIEKGAAIHFEIRRRIPIAAAAAIAVARPFSRTVDVAASDFTRITEAEQSREHVFARVRYAGLPAENDFFVRVFVNLPSASAETPTSDPHFAGSFAFFGRQVAGVPSRMPPPEFLVNVTNTLRELARRQELAAGQPLSFQLVPVPVGAGFENPETELRLEQIELVVTPVVLRNG